MIPYDGEMITVLLRKMTQTQINSVVPRDFQRYPVAKTISASIISELISNERDRRKR